MNPAEFADLFGACRDGRAWAVANCATMDDAWATARPDWLLWIATRKGVLDDRTLRRFAVWCARKVQRLMTDQRSLAALDVAERHADGLATDDELAAAGAAAWATARDAARAAAWAAARDAAWAAARAAAWAAARAAAWATAGAAEAAAGAAEAAAGAAEAAARDAAWAAAWATAGAAAWATAGAAAWAAQADWLRANATPDFSVKGRYR